MRALELVLLIGVNRSIKIEQIVKGLERIGEFGFGKDASTGLGKFDVVDDSETSFNYIDNANACYTLSPCVPDSGNNYKDIFFSPFTRFGRHGDIFAKSGKPFKNPVIMADEGAVFVSYDTLTLDRPYIGRSIGNLSNIEQKTVAQGYSLYLPIHLEV